MKANKLGFTLLELMVVMAIIGTVSAFSFPNLLARVDTTTQDIKVSNAKRFFNGVIVNAKRSRKNLFVTVTQNELEVWSKGINGSKIVQGTLPKNFDLDIEVDRSDINSVKQTLQTSFEFQWAAFESGEYLPLRAQIKSNDQVKTLLGDGVNSLYED